MSGGGLGNAGLVAVIAILPLVVLMLTSFVKVSVVLSLLRNAIGSNDAPSGLVVMGISIILTFFVMAPVAVQMVQAAAESPAVPLPTTPAAPAPTTPSTPADTPARSTQTTPATATPATTTATATTTPATTVPATTTPATTVPATTTPATTTATTVTTAMPAATGTPGPAGPALDLDAAVRKLVPAQYQGDLDTAARAIGPLRAFLARHASARDRATFVDLAGRMGHRVSGDELWVLAPAFLTTELREAFAIAVLIFIPFLVLDLVVGLGLAALGLQTTSPQVVSLPLKLLLFVSVDGWRLLIDSLLRGYV